MHTAGKSAAKLVSSIDYVLCPPLPTSTLLSYQIFVVVGTYYALFVSS